MRFILKSKTQAWTNAILLLVLSLGYVGNCQAQKPVVQAEESKSGAITGRVTNEGGQPLAGAAVSVRPSGVGVYTNRSVLTNSEGNFTVAGLDSGLYFVSAFSPAYVTPPKAPDSPMSLYRVGDDVQIQLARGGVITGTVTNDNGEPVVGARVTVIMSKDATGKSLKGRSFGVRAGQTDDRGVYRVYGLQPGSYVVSAGGGGPTYDGSATELDAPTYAPSATLDTASEFQVQPGTETTADIHYRNQPGHSVSGIIRSLGPNTASVVVYQPEFGMIPMGTTIQTAGTQGFAFHGIADGTYTLVASESLTQTTRTVPDLATSAPLQITVKGADVKGLEVVMKPLAVVNGRIALEPSKLPECQNKKQPMVSEITVGLIFNSKTLEPDQPPILRPFAGSSTPDKDWSFALKNLMGGQYAFNANFFARYWYLKSISFGGPSPTQIVRKSMALATRDATKSWTMIQAGERLNDLTITLAEGAGSIRGRVETNADAKFDTKFRVYLVPAEREKVDDPLRYFATEVTSDGAFFITSLPPGKYLTVAQPPQTDVPLNTASLRYPDAAEARAKLRRAAEAAKAEVELKPCQNVTELQLKQN
ncbi:MAG TPA: carboxypeptidase-like regulatory domain-containing protein [Pyrinomonadaceae bacterium]